MKNVWESLLRRSFDNHILAHRHNRRQDELLEEKFLLYERQIRVIDHHLYMDERRLEKRAQNDLGLVVSYKYEPIDLSESSQFYFKTTKKYWSMKHYTVEPLEHVLEHKNLYQYVFERRSQQYVEELKQRKRAEKLRQEHLMIEAGLFIREKDDKANDWPVSDKARIKLPLIHQSKYKRSHKTHFPIEI